MARNIDVLKARVRRPVLLILCVLLSGELRAEAAHAPDLTYSPPPLLLSDADAAALCRAGLGALQGVRRPFDALPKRLKKDTGLRVVFLSVSDGKTPARIAMGFGNGPAKALQRAATKMRQQTPGIDVEKPTTLRLKLDIVEKTIQVADLRPRQRRPRHSSQLGIAFDWGAGLAFLAEELTTRDLMRPTGLVRLDTFEEYVGKRGWGEAVRLRQLFRRAPIAVARFRSVSYFYDGRRASPLYRGHRLWVAISRDHLHEAALSVGAYLTRSVRKDGRFIYLYHAHKDRISRRYNLVRHAGTLFAMLDLYALTRDEALLDASRRGLDYLRRAAKPFGPPEAEMSCFVKSNGSANLGGPALAVVAMTLYQKLTGDARYAPLMKRLGNFVAGSIRRDGSFISKRDYATGDVMDFQSQYYPGEALLGLVRLYQADAQEKWIEAAQRGAAWLITVRDSETEDSTLTHDHWLLYALDELHRHRPNPMYVEHALRIARVILSAQRRTIDLPDWPGSYYTPPRSAPTATRTEGLLAAYRLLRDTGRKEDSAGILNAIHLGMAFQLQLQIYPETAMYMRRPARALGGVRRNFGGFSIRIDYCQHHLSGILALHRLLQEEGRSELAAPQAMRLLKLREKAAFPWRK